MQVKSILHSGPIHIISADTTVYDAAVKMTELNIGALLVGNIEKLEGIFSERDILKRVVGASLSADKTLVKNVMSKNIITIEDHEVIDIALNIMQEKKIRHLPVINEQGICTGVLGIRGLMRVISEKLEKENKALSLYINEDNTWE